MPGVGAFFLQIGVGLLENFVPFGGHYVPVEFFDPGVSAADDRFGFFGIIVNPEEFGNGVVDVNQGADAFQVGSAVAGPFGGGGSVFQGTAAEREFE